MALGATGVRLRSPVLFAFQREIQKTLAAQSCRQWHPLLDLDKTLARFRHPSLGLCPMWSLQGNSISVESVA